MTDLSQQTDALLKALTLLHRDLAALNLTVMMATGFIAALLLIMAFRKL